MCDYDKVRSSASAVIGHPPGPDRAGTGKRPSGASPGPPPPPPGAEGRVPGPQNLPESYGVRARFLSIAVLRPVLPGPGSTTKPYKFIRFGAMDATKPYNFIGFGAMDATKPYKFIGLGPGSTAVDKNPWGTPGFSSTSVLPGPGRSGRAVL